MSVAVHVGDCRAILPTLPAESIDACVTDPPYGLRFMGKEWDYDVPGEDVWREVYRVLKPGAHLLTFFGTRTYHRGVVRIEDAGFEIRDMIAWVYGQGFPKSLDVSKAIEKAAGALEDEGHGMLKDGASRMSLYPSTKSSKYIPPEPVTPAAREWSGWGTALKPALEPIVVARKPLVGTVAENVQRYGTGGINVDGCRVGTEDKAIIRHKKKDDIYFKGKKHIDQIPYKNGGRWPANLIHDGSEEVTRLFPEREGGAFPNGAKISKPKTDNVYGQYNGTETEGHPMGDFGSAARFFYTAKASSSERDGSRHPTVKPLRLMAYLCRLVTPPGGTVLDPFAGSGTTGEAAEMEGFNSILIELDEANLKDIRKRTAQRGLFAEPGA